MEDVEGGDCGFGVFRSGRCRWLAQRRFASGGMAHRRRSVGGGRWPLGGLEALGR